MLFAFQTVNSVCNLEFVLNKEKDILSYAIYAFEMKTMVLKLGENFLIFDNFFYWLFSFKI